MTWNYEFFSKEAVLQSEIEEIFAEVCFDLTEKFINSQNSVRCYCSWLFKRSLAKLERFKKWLLASPSILCIIEMKFIILRRYYVKKNEHNEHNIDGE